MRYEQYSALGADRSSMLFMGRVPTNPSLRSRPDELWLVYGGSFDPPHRAHVVLPQLVGERLAASRVLYVPAAMSPLKRHRPPTAAHHRVAMLRLALERALPNDRCANRWAAIWTDELDRAASAPGGEGDDAHRPSYTVDTLERLRARLDEENGAGQGATLRLLIGGDNLRLFDRWYRADRILELAEPVVMIRPPDSRDSLLAALPPGQAEVWAPRLLDLPAIDASSTAARANAGSDPSVPSPVQRYIHDHGLYQ